MQTFKALYIDNGIIKAGEFPVEPERHADNLCAANACDHPGAQKGTCECEQYEQAFASAKANAAVCKDQALAKQIVKDAVGHDLDYMTNTDGCMYFIPDGWDYRVERDKETSVPGPAGSLPFWCYNRVAILYRTDEQAKIEELRKKLDAFLATQTKEQLEKWLEMDRGRMKQPEPEESQEDLMYELFRPAYKASDTGEYFRRGHHTSGRKINRDQFYRLLKLIKDNLQENFILTRKP